MKIIKQTNSERNQPSEIHCSTLKFKFSIFLMNKLSFVVQLKKQPSKKIFADIIL